MVRDRSSGADMLKLAPDMGPKSCLLVGLVLMLPVNYTRVNAEQGKTKC